MTYCKQTEEHIERHLAANLRGTGPFDDNTGRCNCSACYWRVVKIRREAAMARKYTTYYVYYGERVEREAPAWLQQRIESCIPFLHPTRAVTLVCHDVEGSFPVHGTYAPANPGWVITFAEVR